MEFINLTHIYYFMVESLPVWNADKMESKYLIEKKIFGKNNKEFTKEIGERLGIEFRKREEEK